MAEDDAPKIEVDGDGIAYQLKETFVTPVGVNVQKYDTPEGPMVFLKFIEGVPAGPGVMVPLEIKTYKLGGAQARDIAQHLLGGIVIAGANEVPK